MNLNLEALPLPAQRRAAELLEALQQKQKFERLSQIDLYEWQRRITRSSYTNAQTMVCAANRVGKSFVGAAITAYHLTGRYPDDWEGHKFEGPIYAWAAGVSSDTTRDIIQSELCGESSDPAAFGTGMIPKDDIVSVIKRRGASGNTYDSVIIKHYDKNGKHDGNSRLGFKSYEMGQEKFFGRSLDWIWLDEQMPDDIYTQCITRTADTAGKILMTFTPEDGITPTINQFFKNRGPGQDLIQVTWDDAPHLDAAVKDQLLNQYPPHEREMRSKGVPFFGSGLVFPVEDDKLIVEPFEIPFHWPMIAGIDFGWDHPTAVVWLRWDRDSDTVYVVDEHRESNRTPLIHSAAINARAKCPVAWPHDGHVHDKGSGEGLADQYRKHGVRMLPSHFTNPPTPGAPKGDIRVEPGISRLLERMETGRFKVFRTCVKWFEEKQMYSRDNGKIIALDDDLMSATRYAEASLRFSEPPNRAGQYAKEPKQDYSWVV